MSLRFHVSCHSVFTEEYRIYWKNKMSNKIIIPHCPINCGTVSLPLQSLWQKTCFKFEGECVQLPVSHPNLTPLWRYTVKRGCSSSPNPLVSPPLLLTKRRNYSSNSQLLVSCRGTAFTCSSFLLSLFWGAYRLQPGKLTRTAHTWFFS